MLELTYDLPAPPRLEKLHDEIAAASVAVELCAGVPGSGRVVVRVADGTARSAVDAAIAAHDPTTPSARAQQAATDAANRAAAPPALRTAVASWGSPSAAQKDDVLRHLARAMAAVLARG
jgi:hypothetical protein